LKWLKATAVFPANPEKCAKPGPKGLVDLALFRGLKPPALSGIFALPRVQFDAYAAMA